jgi:tRNA(fMet)-specific endonuclease VapC
MPRYMLDTDIASYAMKGNNELVYHKFAQVAVGDICISVIVKAEIEFGIAIHPRPAQGRAALNLFLLHVTVLDFPSQAAGDYGQIRADLKTRGQLIGANDMLIAAHARYLDLTLVTNNMREYSRIPGLKLENWAE